MPSRTRLIGWLTLPKGARRKSRRAPATLNNRALAHALFWRRNVLRMPAQAAYLSRMNTVIVPSPAAGTAAPEAVRAGGLMDVRLTDITTVARDTNLYTFARPGGGALPAYKPGAHIDIHIPNGLVRQ